MPLTKVRFCNRSCSNKWQHAFGGRRCVLNTKRTFEWWIQKHGEKGAEEKLAEFKATMSDVTNGEKNPMFGKKQPKLAALNSAQKGKTLEQIYGSEKAKVIKYKNSICRRGEKGPLFGKPGKGGRSVKGKYKGKFFRSLYELSFMKHVENVMCLSLNDVKYECFSIPYILNDGPRRYHPDFFIEKQQCVYEVKPTFAKAFSFNILKADAATVFLKKLGIVYKIMTENDFKKYTFDELKADPDVEWDERSFKFFKKGRK